jgi:hypothetical protein
MTITVTINTDNAAFGDGNEITMRTEVGRCLHLAASHFTKYTPLYCLDGLSVLDLNGNTCGRIEVSE